MEMGCEYKEDKREKEGAYGGDTGSYHPEQPEED